jgi:hypothetical protein
VLSAATPRRAVAAAGAAALAGLAVTAGAAPARADIVRDKQQWVLDAINVAAAWPVTQGAGVTVAVIDSGVDADVPDLAGSVRAGPDLTDVHTSPDNPNWGMHGTWMASLIAGHGHDGGGSGIIGVAPAARILSIRVITDKTDPGYARYQNQPPAQGQQELATGINDAVQDHASVISMSLGYGAPSREVRLALQNAFAHNVVVVASSGNSGDTAGATGQGAAPYSFPANYPGVLGVGAVGESGQAAAFSSQNLSVQVAAPGVDVPAEGRNSGYWTVSGTSPACAITAGVAALIKSKYPHLTDPQVSEAITDSAWRRPRGGYDQQVGFGTVNAGAALTAAGRMAAAGPPGAQSVTPSRRFSAGSAALPAAPVSPRGPLALVAYCLLGAACLGAMALAARRLVTARQPARGTRAAQPAYPGPPPGPARTAAPRPEAGPYGAYPPGRPGANPAAAGNGYGAGAGYDAGSTNGNGYGAAAGYDTGSSDGNGAAAAYPAGSDYGVGNGNGYANDDSRGNGYPPAAGAPASQPGRDYRPDPRRPGPRLPEPRQPEPRPPAAAPLRPIPPRPEPPPPWAQPHQDAVPPGSPRANPGAYPGHRAPHPNDGVPYPNDGLPYPNGDAPHPHGGAAYPDHRVPYPSPAPASGPPHPAPAPAPPGSRRRDARPDDGPPPGVNRFGRSSRSPGRHAAPAEPPPAPGDTP